MVDNHKSGTGEELGRISLGEIGEIVVEDDGDPDRCTRAHLESNLGHDGRSLGYIADVIYDVRTHEGDQYVIDNLAGDATSGSNTTSWDDRQVSFKCQGGCNQTWPGSKNQQPEDGKDDICPDCYDD